MKTLIVCAFILLSSSIFGNPDSLKIEFSTAKKNNDIEKQASILKELAEHYYFDVQNYDTSIIYTKQALEKYKMLGNERNIALCYKYMGYNYVDGQEYELGMLYLDSALPLCEKQEMLLSVIQIYSNKGVATSHISDPQKSIECFSKALEYSLELNDSSQIAINTLNLGIVISYNGDYSKAIDLFLEAEEMFKLIGDTSTLVNTLMQIGEVYDAWDKKDLALEYYNKACDLKEYIKYKTILVSLYDLLGNAQMEKNDYTKALMYFNKALSLSDSIGYRSGISQSYYRLGRLMFEQSKYNEALNYYFQSLEIEEELGSIDDIVSLQTEIGKTFFHLKEYNKAIDFLEKSLKKSKINKMAELERDNCYWLFEVYKTVGEYGKALENYEKYNILEDSIFGEEQLLKIEDIKEKYETEKKEQQIEVLNGEKNLQTERLNKRSIQIIALIVVFTLLAAIGVLFYVQRRRNFQNKQLIVQQKLFRSQMNPHFIFNALNAIKNFTLHNKGVEVADYIIDFSQLMRLILESSAEEFVSLTDELKLLESYLKLQQLRFQNKFSFEINVDNNIDAEEIILPPMLLQPSVENAVEHGIKNGGKNINLNISKKNNSIIIEISDDGPGIELKSQSKPDHKSRAMGITEERIKAIQKTNNWEITYKLHDLGETNNNTSGTKVTFNIPIRIYSKF